MEEITNYIKQKYEIEKVALDMLDKEVDRIINNNITDISVIERTFDLLLGLVFVDSSFAFDKLNNYYETFNKEYSHEYKLIYKEIKEQNQGFNNK